jgi:hypothetical protein
MPSEEIADDVIIEWLGKIFKDMAVFTGNECRCLA